MNKLGNTPEIRFDGFEEPWEGTLLGSCLDVRSGHDHQHLGHVDVPVYGTGGYMVSVDTALSQDEDAIGIGRKGTIDRPYLLHAPFWTVDTLFYAVPLHPKSLAFMLALAQNTQWKRYDESTGVPSLTRNAINAIEVQVPSLPEQQQIGAFFSDLDRRISLQKQKVEKLKQLKWAMLGKMFPAPGSDVPEIRFDGFEEPWETGGMKDLAQRFDNERVPITATERIPGPTPYYGANGVQDYVQGHTHDGEFVLIAEDGASDVHDYPIWVVSGQIWVNNHAHVLQARSGLANNHYLTYALKRVDISQYLVGGTRAKLNAGPLMSLPLPCPSLPEQQQIGAFFSSLDHLIGLNDQKQTKLEQVKKALLERMFV